MSSQIETIFVILFFKSFKINFLVFFVPLNFKCKKKQFKESNFFKISLVEFSKVVVVIFFVPLVLNLPTEVQKITLPDKSVIE